VEFVPQLPPLPEPEEQSPFNLRAPVWVTVLVNAGIVAAFSLLIGRASSVEASVGLSVLATGLCVVSNWLLISYNWDRAVRYNKTVERGKLDGKYNEANAAILVANEAVGKANAEAASFTAERELWVARRDEIGALHVRWRTKLDALGVEFDEATGEPSGLKTKKPTE